MYPKIQYYRFVAGTREIGPKRSWYRNSKKYIGAEAKKTYKKYDCTAPQQLEKKKRQNHLLQARRRNEKNAQITIVQSHYKREKK